MNYVIKKIKEIPEEEMRMKTIMNFCRKYLLNGVFNENINKIINEINNFKKNKNLEGLKKEIILFYRNLNYIEKESESDWEKRVKRLENCLNEKNEIEDIKKVIQESEKLKSIKIKGNKAIDILLEVLK